MTECYDVLDCAAGRVLVAVDESGSVTDIRFLADKSIVPPPGEPARTARVRKQLEEYFAGKRQDFDLPLAPGGRHFNVRSGGSWRGSHTGKRAVMGGSRRLSGGRERPGPWGGQSAPTGSWWLSRVIAWSARTAASPVSPAGWP